MAVDPKESVRPRLQRPGSVIGIAVSRFHEDLTGAMLASAERELRASGVRDEDIHVVWVPGAFELAIVARRMAQTWAGGFSQRKRFDAVVCIALVLKGETEHDRYVSQGAVQGIVAASIAENTPILFGVLTCATLEQARARALPVEEGGREDKGRAVARAAIETLVALDQIEELAP